MKRKGLHIGICMLALLLSGCSKDAAVDGPYQDPKGSADKTLAIGTFRIQDGVPAVRIDAETLSYVVNPDSVSELADCTRIMLEYVPVNRPFPDFCTEAVHVEWASALEVGDIRFDMQASPGDPVDIVTDWMTSLEDGFLTLHYRVYASGNVQHTFSLYPTASPYGFRLVHEAHGDQGGDLTEGIICFPVGDLLPDTGGETVTLSLDYLNLPNTSGRLTVDYRNPA